MTHTAAPQSAPQVILGGINLSALDRDGLKAFVVGLDPSAPNHDALVQVAFRLDRILREAEHGIDAWEAAQADEDVDTAPVPVPCSFGGHDASVAVFGKCSFCDPNTRWIEVPAQQPLHFDL